jgi:hypothetical protein
MTWYQLKYIITQWRAKKSEDLDRVGRAKRLRKMQHQILILTWLKNNQNIITKLAHSAAASMTVTSLSGSSVRRRIWWQRVELFHKLSNPRHPQHISIKSRSSCQALPHSWAPCQRDRATANTYRQPSEERPLTKTIVTALSRIQKIGHLSRPLLNLQRLQQAILTEKASLAFRHQHKHLLLHKMYSLPHLRKKDNM